MKKFSMFSIISAVGLLVMLLATRGSAYEAVEVANGGSLAGVVTFPGAPPALEDLPITKDNDVCGKGKKTSERLILSGNKEVANTVVRLTNVSSGKQLDVPTKPFYLDQKSCGFHPHIQVVPVGGKVAIKNSDNVLHNVHGFIGTKTAFNLAMPIENQIIPKKMKTAGIIRLKCDAGHVWMNGYIVVTDHPYVAMTDEKGKYEITDIPPGNYKVEFWHEGWKIAKKNPGGSVVYSDPVVSVKDVTITAKQKTTLNYALKGQ